MIKENEFKLIVAKNIVRFRKAYGMTQIELAEKLNYSDKAISKWERGESLPDVYMLLTLAEMFGITLNDLVSEEVVAKPKVKFNKSIIYALSCGLTWLVAMIVFVFLQIFSVDYAWLTFIYALPASLIVSIVFSKLYNFRLVLGLSISGLFYTIPLAVCCSLNWYGYTPLLFLIAIPLQILTILWFFRKRKQ